jgi:putative toxin-antitoxin system antitoxin component (TIGR02293 family)
MSQNEFESIVKEAAMAYVSSNEINLVERARRGISKKTLVKVSKFSGISMRELSSLLPVSLRTLQRYNDDDLLEPYVSERVLLITEVLARGLDVFQSAEKLQHWLHTPAAALGNRTPLSLLDTSFGARMVTDMLGRMEYGVYS